MKHLKKRRDKLETKGAKVQAPKKEISNEALGLLIALFLGVILRFCNYLFGDYRIAADAALYTQMARNLNLTGVISDCLSQPNLPSYARPPLLILLLAPLYLVEQDPRAVAFFFNLVVDCLTILFTYRFCRDCKWSTPVAGAFFIAVHPVLLGYGRYTLNENLSLMLMMGALSYFMKTVGKENSTASIFSGLFIGLLSLCRSFFLPLPFLLLVFRKKFKISGRTAGLVMAAAMLFPMAWVVRNAISVGEFRFSQSHYSATQVAHGLCISGFNFDRPEHAQLVLQDPQWTRLNGDVCKGEQEAHRIAKEGLEKAKQCIVESPTKVALRVLQKTVIMLMFWGKYTPYDDVFESLQFALNVVSVVAYFLFVFFSWKRKMFDVGQRLIGLVAGVVVLSTLPFSVENRYFLTGHTLILLFVICNFSLKMLKRTNR